MLDITGEHISRIPSKLLSKLHNLEELYMQGFWEWERLEPNAEGEEGEVNDTFTNASFDEVTMQGFWEWECLELNAEGEEGEVNDTFTNATVSICEGPAPPAMLQNLQSLSITKCKLEGSLFTSDVAQCLFQLNSLELAVCPLLERIVEASNKKIILPKLEQLSLTELPILYKSATFDIECPSLENMSLKGCWFPWEQWRLRKIALSTVSICDGPSRLPPAMFQNLQSLSIEWCKSDGSLFTYDVAQCLSQLNSLKFKNCPLLERIVEASNKKTVLPKLKRLHLEVLPMLYYESDTFDIVCPELEEFFVSSCPKFSASSSDFHSRKQVQFI